MFFNRNYINRTVAGALLFTLIFIHGVKLLHTHSFNLYSSTQTILIADAGNADHFTSFHISADCDICKYYLAKDADCFSPAPCNNNSLLLADINTQIISYLESSPFSSFETRGPPSNI